MFGQLKKKIICNSVSFWATENAQYSKRQEQGKVSWKINKSRFADKSFILNTIKALQGKHNTLKEFLLKANITTDEEKAVYEIL